MNNRKEKMNEFLIYMANIAYYNPNVEINQSLVYRELTYNGIDQEQRNYQLNYFFPKWIEKYKYCHNMEVKNTENWKYFCQFLSAQKSDTNEYHDSIKIYIPLKAEYIEYGAEMLFDFISSQNIMHESKIGSNVRVDNIVVRVYSVEDAKKIQKFVKNNNYLRSGLINPNPFVLSDGLIAYASDGLVSYNTEISHYISEYINYLKENYRLETTNIDDFIRYTESKINYYFNTREGMKDFKNNRVRNSKQQIVSAYEVSKLIKISLRENSKLKDLLKHLKTIKNPEYKRYEEKYIEELSRVPYEQYTQELNRSTYEGPFTQKLLTHEQKKQILYDAIEGTIKKYGVDQINYAIEQYLMKGIISGIPRDNNLRENFSNLSQQDIMIIISEKLGRNFSSNKDIRDFVEMVNKKNVTSDNRITLEQICINILNKNGYDQTVVALRKVIEKNDYSSFASDIVDQVKSFYNQTSVYNEIIQTLLNNNYNSNVRYDYPRCLELYVNHILEKYNKRDNYLI